MEINYQIFQRNVLPIDPVFSNWVNFNKKSAIINCSTNSMNLRLSVFFRNSKVEGFFVQKKHASFFSVSLGSSLFSNCQLAFLNVYK